MYSEFLFDDLRRHWNKALIFVQPKSGCVNPGFSVICIQSSCGWPMQCTCPRSQIMHIKVINIFQLLKLFHPQLHHVDTEESESREEQKDYSCGSMVKEYTGLFT